MKIGSFFQRTLARSKVLSWDVVWSLLLLLSGGLLLSRNHADPDFWGHVQYGREVLRDGLPQTATYTYTAIGFPWVNHEILAEIFFAWMTDQWGPEWLLGLKALTGSIVTLILWRRFYKAEVPILPATLLLTLTLLNLTYYWTLRPQWFSLMSFVVLLILLSDGGAAPGRTPVTLTSVLDQHAYQRMLRRLLWSTPWLFILWTNAHGGFVLGIFFLGAYLGLRCLQFYWFNGVKSISPMVQSAAVWTVAALATLINPYGWQLHTWLWYSLGKARPEISEWHPPGLLDAVFIPWWTLVAVSLLVIVATPRRRDLVHLILLTLTLWQSLKHLRHIPFFALTFAWWYARDVGLVWSHFVRRNEENAAEENTLRHKPVWLWAAAACGFVGIGFLLYQQVRCIPVHRHIFPVDAVQFMAKHKLNGRIVARFDWAQYVLETFANAPPGHQIFLAIDGRYDTCYPRWVLDMYFDFCLGNDPRCRNRAKDSPPYDPFRVLEYGNPDLVLLGCEERHPRQTIASRGEEWVLLYHDPVAEIWGRRSRYDDPQSPHYFPPEKRVITDKIETGYVPWPGHPRWNAPARDAL